MDFISYRETDDLFQTLRIMELFCTKAVIMRRAESEVRDAKDLYLLSLAETVRANYILTGDKDLLVLHKHKQTTILTLTDFFNLHS